MPTKKFKVRVFFIDGPDKHVVKVFNDLLVNYHSHQIVSIELGVYGPTQTVNIYNELYFEKVKKDSEFDTLLIITNSPFILREMRLNDYKNKEVEEELLIAKLKNGCPRYMNIDRMYKNLSADDDLLEMFVQGDLEW